MLSVDRRVSSCLHSFRRLCTQSAARSSCCSPSLFTALLVTLFDLPFKVTRKEKPPTVCD